MTQNTMPVGVSGAPGAEPPDFPMARTCPFDPPAEYAGFRHEQPVVKVRVPNDQEAWLVTRYEDVRNLLTDPRVSSDRTQPGMPLTEEVTPQTRRNIAAFGKSLIGLDHPEHGPRRRMLVTEFTMRRMRDLRPHIQHTVDHLIDDILAGPKPADLVPALAVQVPARTLTELLGVPFEARDLIERSATAQLRRSISPEERQRTSAELRAYVEELIAAKEADPTDDLLGRLVLTNRRTGLYDREQMVGLTILLLVAGFETTVSMIALGITGLLGKPDKIPGIVADPIAAASAVEELLRYFTVVDSLPRVALADIKIGDTTVKAGEGLMLSFLSANWDDDVFPGAEAMDTERGARHHMAFGYGVHQCIGQNLAREELLIVYRTLFQRIPTLRLAGDLNDLPFRTDSNIFGLDSLPVTW